MLIIIIPRSVHADIQQKTDYSIQFSSIWTLFY